MARVTHVKKARKDNQVAAKGEPYYWWKFRYGGKHYSKTYPRASQLTQSEYLGTLYSMQEAVEDYEIENYEDTITDIEDWKDQLEELQGECEEKRESMPEQLQDSEVGELLGERAEACETMAASMEEVADKVKQLKDDSEEEAEERKKRKHCSIQVVTIKTSFGIVEFQTQWMLREKLNHFEPFETLKEAEDRATEAREEIAKGEADDDDEESLTDNQEEDIREAFESIDWDC